MAVVMSSWSQDWNNFCSVSVMVPKSFRFMCLCIHLLEEKLMLIIPEVTYQEEQGCFIFILCTLRGMMS
jgi:hypothetical protein